MDATEYDAFVAKNLVKVCIEIYSGDRDGHTYKHYASEYGEPICETKISPASTARTPLILTSLFLLIHRTGRAHVQQELRVPVCGGYLKIFCWRTFDARKAYLEKHGAVSDRCVPAGACDVPCWASTERECA